MATIPADQEAFQAHDDHAHDHDHKPGGTLGKPAAVAAAPAAAAPKTPVSAEPGAPAVGEAPAKTAA